MAEYIERESVLAKCREIAACEWNHRASPVSWADAYEQFAEDVEEIPSSDVAPVRNGRWMNKGSLSCRCSECGCKSNKETQWCPNCGAKMDGDG